VRAERRARKAHVSAFVLVVPQLRLVINVCCQASRRAKRAAKEEEILAQSALCFREAFVWLERCVPVALSRVLSLLWTSDVQASPHVRVPGLGVSAFVKAPRTAFCFDVHFAFLSGVGTTAAGRTAGGAKAGSLR